jgi:hypothetical protein
MPIKVREQTNGHNPAIEEVPPTVEAEVIEDLEEPMYAYSEPEPEEELAEPQPTTEDTITVELRSLIPITKEDYEKGFRGLTDDERKRYGISKEPMTREDAGRKEFNLSSQRVGEHVRELLASRPPFPRGYLFENGNELSDRCRFEIFQKIENASSKVLPGDPRDWRNLKKSRKVANPRYKTHRFKYWESNSKRCSEYHNWLESQPEPEVEIHDAEFVPPTEEPPEDREERLSKKRSQIQKVETERDRIIREYMKQQREQILQIVEEEALETKFQMDKRHQEIINNPDITAPPDLDDDEDL